MPKEQQIKKSEVIDLFAESKVGGYVVKPWTITQFVSLSPVLKQISDTLKEKGYDISQADIQNFSLGKEVTASDVVGLLNTGIDVFGPVISQIISVSIRVKKEEVEEMDWGMALALAANIIALNWEHIKNWLGQIPGIPQSLAKTETSPLVS